MNEALQHADQCALCVAPLAIALDAQILKKYEVVSFRCEACGFMQREKPSWLDEAYCDTIIKSYTGLVMRTIKQAAQVAASIQCLFDCEGFYADMVGGYCLLTRLIRNSWIHVRSATVFIDRVKTS